MSMNKLTDHEKRLIVERSLKAFGCKNRKELADILHISAQNMTNRVKKGTAFKLIEDEALKRNVNFKWLLTGEGEMLSGGGELRGAEANSSTIEGSSDKHSLTEGALQDTPHQLFYEKGGGEPVKWPREVYDVFAGDDEDLKEQVVDYIIEQQAKKRRLQREQGRQSSPGEVAKCPDQIAEEELRYDQAVNDDLDMEEAFKAVW